MIVLDANILIRAVLGRSVQHLLDTYTARGVRFYAPDVAFVDAQEYLPPLLVKKGKPVADVSAAIEYLQHIVEPVDQDSMSFLKPTPGSACADVTRMIGPCWPRHLDWPVPYGPKILIFFGTGIAVWTTSRVEIFLQAQVNFLGRFQSMLWS